MMQGYIFVILSIGLIDQETVLAMASDFVDYSDLL